MKHNEIIEACERAGLRCEYLNTGGGCMVLDFPMSEDGTRYAWFGCGQTEDEALHWPYWDDDTDYGPDAHLLVIGYQWEPYEGDKYGWEHFTEPLIEPIGDGDVGEKMRSMLTRLMAVPDEEYQPA
jgi:hypothetical protein